MIEWKLNKNNGCFRTFNEETDQWEIGIPSKGDLIQVTDDFSYTYTASNIQEDTEVVFNVATTELRRDPTTFTYMHIPQEAIIESLDSRPVPAGHVIYGNQETVEAYERELLEYYNTTTNEG